MNWASINFDWNQARAFLATAQEGSLSAAARALGQTQPTLGRQVAALETALGVTLFERVGRSLALTLAGKDLLDHVRSMADAANRVSLAATAATRTIDGRVRITASDVFSAYLMPAFLGKMREIAPRLELDVVADDNIRDLQRREADIAVRHVRPQQPALIARLVKEESAHFYAASAYLDKRGRPRSRADLARHDFVHFGDPRQMIDYLAPYGVEIAPGNFRVGSQSGIVAWEMVKSGLGIMMMSDRLALATSGVEEVLNDDPRVVFPIWLTTHRELHTSQRIRLVFDHLVDHIRETFA